MFPTIGGGRILQQPALANLIKAIQFSIMYTIDNPTFKP
jgi:hypothetical protein